MPAAKIFLGNIAESTQDHQLRPLFEKFGEVTECDIVANFGFVHMQNEHEATAAIDAINGKVVNGKALSVELSKKPPRSGGGRGGFDRGRGGGRGDWDGGRGGGKMGFDRGRGRGFGGPGRGRGMPPGAGRGRYEEEYPPRRDSYGERDRHPPPPPRDRYDPYSRAAYDRAAYDDYYRSRAYAEAYERERRPAYDRHSPPPYERSPYPPPPRRESPPPPRDPYARPPPEYYDRARSHYDSPAYSRRDAPSDRPAESEDRRRDYISGPPREGGDRLPPSASAYERPDYSRTEAKSADPYGRYGSAPSKLPPASGAYGNGIAATPDPYSASRDPYASSVASRDPYASSAARDPYAASRTRDPYAAAPAPRDPYATPATRDPYASAATRDPYASAAAANPYGSTPSRDPYASGPPPPSSARQILGSAGGASAQAYLQKTPTFF